MFNQSIAITLHKTGMDWKNLFQQSGWYMYMSIISKELAFCPSVTLNTELFNQVKDFHNQDKYLKLQEIWFCHEF